MTSRWSNGSAPLVGQHGDCFADIQRAAAAESQNGVATGFGDQRHPSAYPLDRWLGRDSECNARDAGLGQRRPDGVRTRCRTAGHNQNATCPERGERSGTSLTRPAPNRTSAGTARSKRTTGYQSESSGDVLTYRVASRGLAIMGATMSRHR